MNLVESLSWSSAFANINFLIYQLISFLLLKIIMIYKKICILFKYKMFIGNNEKIKSKKYKYIS